MATNGSSDETKMDVEGEGTINVEIAAGTGSDEANIHVVDLPQTDAVQAESGNSDAPVVVENSPIVETVSVTDSQDGTLEGTTVVIPVTSEEKETVQVWTEPTVVSMDVIGETAAVTLETSTEAVITLPVTAAVTVPTSLPLTTVTVSTATRRPSVSSPGKPSFRQWTFEEQFKQLYELSGDKDRRDFLDSLFDFMQRRGTPVNRIPIMAKTTLDLYKLFCEVVARGGLVEVINKKLWREVANALLVPSSITSAAFTLRTQYIKYLYPYECETKHLSSPEELHLAVDVNRRDARTPVAGTPQTPGTPHTPVRLLIDPNQASPLLASQSQTSTPSTAEPLAKKPRLSVSAATAVTPALAGGAIPTATLTALPTTPYCNIRISHAAADASGNVQELPPSEAAASDGSTIFVSMEINGLLYQGFLYVRQPLITVQPTAAAAVSAAAAAAMAPTPNTSS